MWNHQPARFLVLRPHQDAHLTVNSIDRSLSANVVSVNKLELVGATAIFNIAKYE